jgi:hypothetical protein
MSQEINQTDGVQLSTQVVENHSKIFPTPYKTKETQQQRTTTICPSKLQLFKTKNSKNFVKV